MPALKSKKISLAILAAVLSMNWYVSVQTTQRDQFEPPDFSTMQTTIPYLPALDATSLPPTLATISKDFHERILSFQEFPALAFMPSLHVSLTKSFAQQQSMPQPISLMEDETAPTISAPASTPAVMRDKVAADNTAPASPKSHNRHLQQPDNLVKVLALYYMLNR